MLQALSQSIKLNQIINKQNSILLLNTLRFGLNNMQNMTKDVPEHICTKDDFWMLK